MPQARARARGILPGFGLSTGCTLAYLGVIVLLPLSMIAVKAASGSGAELWRTVASARALASYRLTFGVALGAAVVNAALGVLIAWVLVRYRFPGRSLLDSLLDLPFALPTAVSGIALTTLYAEGGWLGRPLAALGIKVAFTPLGITLALVFVGLPFVVRSVQPVLEALGPDLEEAAAALGASRLQTFSRVLLPQMLPALLTGFALAFARGLGEYGSVVFISGNMPGKTEVTTLLIMTKLQQFDYPGAAALAAVMLSLSFVLLLLINRLQAWTMARRAA